MPRTVEHRSVTPLLSKLRDIIRGRPIKPSLRYADLLASRTQPPPNVPGGPYHRLSKIYYYTRDARREVQPPLLITTAAKRIGTGNEESSKSSSVTPGKTYQWD